MQFSSNEHTGASASHKNTPINRVVVIPGDSSATQSIRFTNNAAYFSSSSGAIVLTPAQAAFVANAIDEWIDNKEIVPVLYG